MVINGIAPNNGYIVRTHVVIASRGKPFEWSLKGMVTRKATIKIYEEEIEDLHQRCGDRVATTSGSERSRPGASTST